MLTLVTLATLSIVSAPQTAVEAGFVAPPILEVPQDAPRPQRAADGWLLPGELGDHVTRILYDYERRPDQCQVVIDAAWRTQQARIDALLEEQGVSSPMGYALGGVVGLAIGVVLGALLL